MKKIFALLFVAFIALNASAQTPATDSWKPQQGNVGFTFGLSGLANIGVNAGVIPTGTLLFRYYIADDMAIRAGINFSSSSNTAELKDSVGFNPNNPRDYRDAKVVTKSSSWGVNLGIQKSFGDNSRLEPYIGADIWIGGGKSGKIDTTVNTTFANANSSSSDTYSSTVSPGSSFSFGITPFVGFNWFIAKQFAIGAEFGWGLSITSTPAGTYTFTDASSVTIAGTTTSATATGTSNSSSSKGTSLGGHGTGMITCSVFFNP